MPAGLPASTVNAYVLNDRVAWTRARNDLRYSLFSATVITSETEQDDTDALGKQVPLRRLPKLGEAQLPSGTGLPPESQAFLGGMNLNFLRMVSARTMSLDAHPAHCAPSGHAYS